MVVLHDIVIEMKKQKLDYVSSLEQLQTIIGYNGKYGNTKLGLEQHKAITMDINEFIEFVLPTSEG
jgi:hypothetical protein